MNRFYLTPYSFIFSSLNHPELTSIIEGAIHHTGVFNLLEYDNNSPSTVFRYIINQKINSTQYMNVIIDKAIIQTKLLNRHT
jgi:hypothetical protein